MKALTTIFESILGQNDSLVWTPSDGPTEVMASIDSGWSWGGIDASARRGWSWGG